MSAKKIVIASTNPSKINAVLIGFQTMFPEETFVAEGISVPSGVSDQPFSDAETLQGAYNRTENARKERPDADYWAGIEGGLEDKGDEMYAFTWVVIINSTNSIGKGRTSTFVVPPPMVAMVRAGRELGDAHDSISGKINAGHRSGTVGLITNDVIERTPYNVQAVILALAPFRNPELYP